MNCNAGANPHPYAGLGGVAQGPLPSAGALGLTGGKPVTHKAPADRPSEVLLCANPCGGFVIAGVPGDFRRISMAEVAAFSTLDEALMWLRENMARPTQDKSPG